MSGGRKCQEARERGRGRECRVEVERLHVRHQGLNRALRIECMQQFGEPGRGVWQEATGVRKNHLDRSEACQVASRDKIDSSPRRIERIVRDWSRYSRQQWYLRLCRMNVDDCAAPIQFLPERLERGVPQVYSIIVVHPNVAIHLQLLDG